LSSQGADALSKDQTIGYIPVALDMSRADLDEDEANDVIDAEAPARDAGLNVATGGYLGQEVSKPEVESSEVIGLVAAMIILSFTFGTAAAMGLPISTAILGLIAGLSAIALLGHAVQVPTVAPTLGAMMGLGVGIDYALFIVTRHRVFLAEGKSVEESAARAVATAGGAVVFAGGTVVVIALIAMGMARIPIVTALGASAAIVVVIAVSAAITLLPAMLAILGRRIESLRVPCVKQRPHDHKPHGWARWARGVGRRPWPAMMAAVALLLFLAIPILNLRLGQQDNGQLPTSTTVRQAYDILAEGFGPGVNGPFLIAVDFDGSPAHPDHKKLNQLEAKQQKQEQQAKQQEPQAIAQTTQQLIAEGVPPDEAQAQAEQQVKAQAPRGHSAEQQQKVA
jgi:putative drug exporter of the RND superfamily